MYSGIKNMSIVSRMIIIYLLGPLLLFVSFCIIMILFMVSVMEEKLQLSMESDLKQRIEYIDETTDTLMMIVEQMAFGNVSNHLTAMIQEENPYEKSSLIQTISNEINVISFTNQDIRLLGYYDRKIEKFVFVSNGSIDDSGISEEGILMKKYEFIFSGPHVSHARNHQDQVISVLKKVPGAEQIDAYAEIAMDFDTEQSFMKNSLFIIRNSQGELLYHGLEENELNQEQWDILQRETDGKIKDYYFIKMNSVSGYEVTILTPKSEFIHIYEAMIPGIFASILAFGMIFSLAAYLLYKDIIHPLTIFKEEIKEIQKGDFSVREHKKTHIPEYDQLLNEVSVMKEKILILLEETENAQRLQAKARVEQLLYKINPHFLMNSLDTIHWLAVDRKEAEIDSVAKALNKLLYYNLKMDDYIVTIEDELWAVGQYIILQQSRFHFTYQVELSEDAVKQAQVPRFLLQPMVENAIYHGVNENGTITLHIWGTDRLEIEVTDDGEGMTQEKLDHLMNEIQRDKEGKRLGIGLNYVIRILKEKYGEEAVITIQSKSGEGTKIHISMPMTLDSKKRGNANDKGTDCRG